ncbi:hypothetical protein PHLCEN_2v9516 [Hermanssonia centrifuga]|uniref:Uncharacterized protein n=1 Tax=Hermanssonia centrifuga TaxID=98765 RepID=A0A2R6NQH1_9APHY|nr:hypothetical protein PHLCEN_2v9516 [Hermanssonia centrifuga]
MDDYPHESSTLHSLTRKRKADSDDCQLSNTPSNNTADSVLLDTAATPRMPCKPQNGHHLLPSWQQQQLMSTSVSIIPTFCQEGPSRPKRPRIEIPYAVPAASRRLRRGRISHSPMASPTRRFVRRARLVDIRDTGIVSAVEPRRVPPLRTGNLPPPSPSPHTRISHSVPVTPIEPISPHIPSHQPPINRETLKELDLEAILRNPQLRS